MTNEQLEQTTRDEDLDFDAVFAPASTFRPEEAAGYVQRRAYKGRANLAATGVLRLSDAEAADLDNGRAF